MRKLTQGLRSKVHSFFRPNYFYLLIVVVSDKFKAAILQEMDSQFGVIKPSHPNIKNSIFAQIDSDEFQSQ